MGTPSITGRLYNETLLKQDSGDGVIPSVWWYGTMLPGRTALAISLELKDTPARPPGTKVRVAAWSGGLPNVQPDAPLANLPAAAYSQDLPAGPADYPTLSTSVVVETAGPLAVAIFLHDGTNVLPMNPTGDAYWGANAQGYLYWAGVTATLLSPYTW